MSRRFEFYLFLLLGLSFVLVLSSGGCQKRERAENQETAWAGVRVRVLNGTGVARLAWMVAWDMSRRGFNVYGTGDAKERCERTAVVDLLDRSGENARVLARALAVRPRIFGLPLGKLRMPEVRVKIDSSLFADVLVILGDDYRTFFPEVTLGR